MKKRAHVKSHGAASFQELARATSIAWKAIDKPTFDFCTIVAAILRARHTELKTYMGEVSCTAAVKVQQDSLKELQKQKNGFLIHQSKIRLTAKAAVVKPAAVAKRKSSPNQVLRPSQRSKLSKNNNEDKVQPVAKKTSSIQPRSSSDSEILKSCSTEAKPADSTPNVNPPNCPMYPQGGALMHCKQREIKE